MATVLTENQTLDTSSPAGPALWLEPQELEQLTGWALKPEGFCKDEVCVPLPTGQEAEYVRDTSVNATALWSLLGNPAAHSQAMDVWSLGESASSRNDDLKCLKAPDFNLPDFNGKLHSLTDFQRKRILLITWASW